MQNVYVHQSENNILSLLMEMCSEIASLKTGVVDFKKEIMELKITASDYYSKRQFINLMEEVVVVKLEAQKQHGLDIVADELKDTQKLPFNEIKYLHASDDLVQQI